LQGDEYKQARKLGNSINSELHREFPELLRGFQIHEINPIKFGGSPFNLSNKMILTRSEHTLYNTFWFRLQRSIEKKIKP